jgi:hypothetical protein
MNATRLTALLVTVSHCKHALRRNRWVDSEQSSIAFHRWTAAVVGVGALVSVALTPSANAADCSPVNGRWFSDGKPGPFITQQGDRLAVDMSAYGRPYAGGRFLNPTQIEVTFPDDATFTGTLDGQGRIRWSNGTVWDARSFAAIWRSGAGERGPIIVQTGDSLTVDMSAYGRPVATGRVTAPSVARVTFPDDGTYTATLVSPSCIRWSNGTTWTKY